MKMHCPNCSKNGYKNKMKEQHGQFSYKECGLDNVFFEHWRGLKCSICGLCLPILPDAVVAGYLIAREILVTKEKLTGDQVLFLRKLTGLSPVDFASLIDLGLGYVGENHHDLEKIEFGQAELLKDNETKLKVILSGYIVLLLDKINDSAVRKSGAYGCLVATTKLAAYSDGGKIFLYYKTC